MLDVSTALMHTVILGAVIFLCRFLPFLLFKDNADSSSESKTTVSKIEDLNKNRMQAFFEFVEASVPAVAMTVLAFNALASPIKEVLTVQPPDMSGIIPLGIAALLTAAVHVWKRNPLLSIFGGTALYMLLTAVI